MRKLRPSDFFHKIFVDAYGGRVYVPLRWWEDIAVSANGDHPFERKPVTKDERLLVESKCALCGFRIVGSVADSLIDDEEEHASKCPKKKAKDTAVG